MPYKILTVSREIGSAGHTVACLVAKELQIPCYDKNIVDKIAVETGFSPEYIKQESEYAKSRSFLAYAFSSQGDPSIMGGMSPADRIWIAQSKVICDVAEKESCVIVGRCADYILKDRKDALHVFIHANKDFRAKRLVDLYGDDGRSPIRRLDEQDDKRRVHYRHFTGRNWGEAKNYNLSIDTSAVGIEKAAKIIVDIMKNAGR